MATVLYELEPGESIRATGSRSRSVRRVHVVGHPRFATHYAVINDMLATDSSASNDPSAVNGASFALWQPHPDRGSIYVQAYAVKTISPDESIVSVIYEDYAHEWGAAEPINIGTRWQISGFEQIIPLWQQINVAGRLEWNLVERKIERGVIHAQDIVTIKPSSSLNIDPYGTSPADFIEESVNLMATQIDRLFMTQGSASSPPADRIPYRFTGATIYPDGLWRWTGVLYFTTTAPMKALTAGQQTSADLPDGFLNVPSVPNLGLIESYRDAALPGKPPKYLVTPPLKQFRPGEQGKMFGSKKVPYTEAPLSP